MHYRNLGNSGAVVSTYALGTMTFGAEADEETSGRILEAYVNEVFLGQQGAQAVHGFAAASEFYFGRDLRALGSADIALLVGMVQGPSLYDPRRNPDRALTRRNIVLGAFRDTGLIDEATFASASKQPIGIAANSRPSARPPAPPPAATPPACGRGRRGGCPRPGPRPGRGRLGPCPRR